MSTQIIQADRNAKGPKIQGDRKLAISEFFCDTLQGESVSAGIPATFLRLQHCTLNCVWCDTLSVWKYGREYSFDELFELMNQHQMQSRLEEQRLVLTGGSPLRQQWALKLFLDEIREVYAINPYVEVENECVLPIELYFAKLVNQWNNSPKLSNSGMRREVRYKPQRIVEAATMPNSWFKFVVDVEQDWNEIEEDFLNCGLINQHQVILMPQGATQEELNRKRDWVANLTVKKGVRFSDRLHVTIWNKQTGV